jgi:hypothetical protein
MMHLAFLALAPASHGGDDHPPSQGTDGVHQVYDLGTITPVFDEQGWSLSTFAPLHTSLHELPRSNARHLYSETTPDVVVELLSAVLGEELNQPGRDISIEDNSKLLLLVPAVAQSKARAMLNALEQGFTASIEIGVDIVLIQGSAEADWPQRGILEPGEADRLLASWAAKGGQRRSHVLRIQPGRTSVIDLSRRISFLGDYDVEIAQGAATYDPVIFSADEGLQLFVRGSSAAGGTALTLFVSDAQLFGGVQTHDIELSAFVGIAAKDEKEPGQAVFLRGPEKVQSVDVLFRSIAADTYLPDGKTAVLAMRTAVGPTPIQELVVLRKLGGSIQPFYATNLPNSSNRLLIVDTEAVQPVALQVLRGEEELSSDGTYPGFPHVVVQTQGDPALTMFDWIAERFANWQRMGSWALILTDPSWDEDAAGQLERFVARSHAAVDLLELDVALRQSGGATPLRFSLPVRAGSSCGVTLGEARTAVVDYDVEVAQFSSVADPTPGLYFSGGAWILEPSRSSTGAVSLAMRGAGHVQVGQSSGLHPGTPLLGGLELAQFDRLEVDERMTVTPQQGQPARFEIGDKALAGPGPALRLDILLR